MQSPFIIHLGAIPWATALVPLLQPIRAGYAGAMVTGISLYILLILYALDGYCLGEELPILALVFTSYAIMASMIAYLVGLPGEGA